MTILVVVNHRLPNTETKMFSRDGNAGQIAIDFRAEKQKYKESGKLLSESIDVSEDGLNSKYSALWTSKEDYQEFLQNTILKKFWKARNEYNKANGITITKSVTEV